MVTACHFSLQPLLSLFPAATGGFPSFYNQELIPKRSSGLELGGDQVELTSRTSGPGLEPSLAAGRQPCHQGTGDRQDVPGSSTDGAQQQLRAGITRAAPVAQDMDPRTGQEPVRVLGVVLGIGLALLILASFGYTFIRWYRRGHCQRRPDFVFSLYHSSGLGSVALQPVPPFSISGSLGTSGSAYEPFHSQRP
ncbi:small integral membrane protein 35 isoform X2 [Melospiza melodia melodia]|uniref:small integral membrane protein 35 isoform X2 n=2 Tax=Melospiza TaxID=44395 RepID=UPI002FD4BCCF